MDQFPLPSLFPFIPLSPIYPPPHLFLIHLHLEVDKPSMGLNKAWHVKWKKD